MEDYPIVEPPTDPSALAKMMLDWELLRLKLDKLEAQIKYGVLELGKTQTVGNVRATYSRGRRTYDYRAAIDAAGYDSPSQLAPWRKVTYDYRQACKELKIDDIPFTQGEPSVSVKLLS